MNRDFEEMLRALSEAGADCMVIGAHAVAVYARPRATGDLDIWVRPTPDDAKRVWQALVAFGAPLHELTPEDPIRSKQAVGRPRDLADLAELEGLEEEA